MNVERHPIGTAEYAASCRARFDAAGVLLLDGFLRPEAISQVVAGSARREADAFYAQSTHNVYLTPSDPSLPAGHAYNRQVASSKGLIADDEIPPSSPLRDVYEDKVFRRFLGAVLGVADVFPYADTLSSVNVHFAAEGMELGWHFDNSSFAVTILLQAPDAGGIFEYVPEVRDVESGDMAFDRVGEVLDGGVSAATLRFRPGDLVLFRGRNALHRVTPTIGNTTRMLAVLAFNDKPGVRLSESALATFYGRTE